VLETTIGAMARGDSEEFGTFVLDWYHRDDGVWVALVNGGSYQIEAEGDGWRLKTVRGSMLNETFPTADKARWAAEDHHSEFA